MRSPRSRLSCRALLGAFALAIVLGLATALAPARPQPLPGESAGPTASSTQSPSSRTGLQGAGPAVSTGTQGFPEPLARAWALVVLCGALGALAGELVASGQIDGPRRGRKGWMLGLAGRMMVGVVAAMLVLSLNPPGGSWLKLVGAGLGAGVGGEAVLLSILAARRAQVAEKNLEAAEAQTALGATLAIEKIETFRALSIAARRGDTGGAGNASGSGGAGSHADFDQIINTYADRAKAEIAATVG